MVWLDELRNAPPLELKHVRLQLVNRGGNPLRPARRAAGKLARPLDLRGDLPARPCSACRLERKALPRARLCRPRGMEHVGDIPIEFTRGTGGVRSWLTFSEDGCPRSSPTCTSPVQTRLETDFPELELTELSGRLGWKVSATASRSPRGARADHASGTLPPIVPLRLDPLQAARPERGELSATRSTSRRS